MNTPIEWLLASPAYVEYRARLDLLEQSPTEEAVRAARARMLVDPRLTGMVADLQDFHGTVLNSHKSPSQPFHRLNFLVDIGWQPTDPGMDSILLQVLSRQSAQGPFQLVMNIAAGHGGTGENIWSWALCDAPLLLYAVITLGMADDPRVQKGVDYLLTLVRDNGFPCAVAPELKFRGPGRKGDPCPYANLAMLKMLAAHPDLREHPAARTGSETLLQLWQHRQEEHPYIFYMGNDFCKLKAPLIWYDLLHVLDVLSRFPAVIADPRYGDMLAILAAKADEQGRFTPETVWQFYKDWDFGQKKAPSPWLTLLAQRILRRSQG